MKETCFQISHLGMKPIVQYEHWLHCDGQAGYGPASVSLARGCTTVLQWLDNVWAYEVTAVQKEPEVSDFLH